MSRYVTEGAQCQCTHTLADHVPGVACRRCPCRRFSVEPDDRAEDMRDPLWADDAPAGWEPMGDL